MGRSGTVPGESRLSGIRVYVHGNVQRNAGVSARGHATQQRPIPGSAQRVLSDHSDNDVHDRYCGSSEEEMRQAINAISLLLTDTGLLP